MALGRPARAPAPGCLGSAGRGDRTGHWPPGPGGGRLFHPDPGPPGRSGRWPHTGRPAGRPGAAGREISPWGCTGHRGWGCARPDTPRKRAGRHGAPAGRPRGPHGTPGPAAGRFRRRPPRRPDPRPGRGRPPHSRPGADAVRPRRSPPRRTGPAPPVPPFLHLLDRARAAAAFDLLNITQNREKGKGGRR